mmetsp:Transcript_20715/g.52211  ORF Transcript_20715/g.52211 Transcript_20715/m.52211 type:complete len:689 (-) Transcript_20715:168-2234(-)
MRSVCASVQEVAWVSAAAAAAPCPVKPQASVRRDGAVVDIVLSALIAEVAGAAWDDVLPSVLPLVKGAEDTGAASPSAQLTVEILHINVALDLDLVREVLRVEIAALVHRTDLLDKITLTRLTNNEDLLTQVRYFTYSNTAGDSTLQAAAECDSHGDAPPAPGDAAPLAAAPASCLLLPSADEGRNLSKSGSAASAQQAVNNNSETDPRTVTNTVKSGPDDDAGVERVVVATLDDGDDNDLATTATTAAAELTTGDRGGAVGGSSAPSTSGRSCFGVQRVLGVARAVCRWLAGWRRTASEVVAAGTGLLLAVRGGRGVAAAVDDANGNDAAHRLRPLRLLMLVLRRGPHAMLTLWPSLPWLCDLLPSGMGVVPATGVAGTAALVCFGLGPLLTGAGGPVGQALAFASEGLHSALSCWCKAGRSLSQFASNGGQFGGLLLSATTGRGLGSADPLAAADFALYAAAFTHLVAVSAVRWRGGGGAERHAEVPEATKQLGFLAKIMYDDALPPTVHYAGDTLSLMPDLSDASMAVYVTGDLREGGAGPGGRVAVCHRGTWAPRDLLDDLFLLTGTFRASGRYREASRRCAALARLWPGATFTHVGHSLGGSVAMALVERLPEGAAAEAHAFNPGISFEGFASERSTIHLIDRDVIGFAAPAHPGARCNVYPAHSGVRYLPSFAHPHSVTNFW